MKNQRLKQIGLSLCVVLSLLISSVAACACSHHQEFEIVKTSCHEHSEMTMTMDVPPQTEQAEAIQNTFTENLNCSCVQSAPKVFSKSELAKIEKQAAKNAPVIEIEFQTIQSIAKSAKADFSKPFYLSDSFYNLKSPRAPPRL